MRKKSDERVDVMTVEKVALVTAGGSGMGADAAKRLAADGFKLAILVLAVAITLYSGVDYFLRAARRPTVP